MGSNIYKSLEWTVGTPQIPGVKRRVYYISKSQILNWPTLSQADNKKVTDVTYNGSFVLAEDAVWQYIDMLAEKSTLTSETQGEAPSQTFLNKMTIYHPGVDEQASAASIYMANDDLVFLAETMHGKFRVIGSELWTTTTTVAQDNGQGSTGSTNTTISVEAPDLISSPFYSGLIETADGDFNADGSEIETEE